MGSTTKSPSGNVGVLWRTYLEPDDVEDREPIDEIHLQDANFFWYAELIGIFTPEESGEYEFGVILYGTAKLYVNDVMFDNETVPTQGDALFWMWYCAGDWLYFLNVVECMRLRYTNFLHMWERAAV
ncbi:hypothetical protein V1524DRAFT_441844 [Lipomyces starkeyi]